MRRTPGRTYTAVITARMTNSHASPISTFCHFMNPPTSASTGHSLLTISELAVFSATMLPRHALSANAISAMKKAQSVQGDMRECMEAR
jgi:hypothetical protein